MEIGRFTIETRGQKPPSSIIFLTLIEISATEFFPHSVHIKIILFDESSDYVDPKFPGIFYNYI